MAGNKKMLHHIVFCFCIIDCMSINLHAGLAQSKMGGIFGRDYQYSILSERDMVADRRRVLASLVDGDRVIKQWNYSLTSVQNAVRSRGKDGDHELAGELNADIISEDAQARVGRLLADKFLEALMASSHMTPQEKIDAFQYLDDQKIGMKVAIVDSPGR